MFTSRAQRESLKEAHKRPSGSSMPGVLHGRYRPMRQEKGQSVVEFALVLPLLLLLLLGLVNIGLLINSQIILTHAAWEGARAGATLNSDLGEGDVEIGTAVLRGASGLADPHSVIIEVFPDEAARNMLPWPEPRGQSLMVNLSYSFVPALPFRMVLTLTTRAVSRIEYSNPP